MRFILWLTVWLRRLVVLALILGGLFGVPILYIEIACKGTPGGAEYASLLPPEARRGEGRTYTTYPEWHIVHAYEDYAKVIETGDPHEYEFFTAVKGFWLALCPLAQQAAEHGGFTAESKRTIYIIGSSFTVEMLFKAAYEESLGRLMTLVRGEERAPLDDLSAQQAAAYAEFLRQTPWYKWQFGTDASALWAAKTGTPRDWERALALNVELRSKVLYAKLIEAAVAATGTDALTVRSIVTGLTADQLAELAGVTVIGPRANGLEIETARYRELTVILQAIAAAGGDVIEIAGNDDIVLTVLSPQPVLPGALHSFQRQGFGDYRHLIESKVWGLSDRLRQYAELGVTVEHVHDY